MLFISGCIMFYNFFFFLKRPMTPKSGKIIYFLGCLCVLPISFAVNTGPIHHPPLGGCNGDLICFICLVLSEPFTSVSNLLRSCQAKGEMNDKKNPRQARGTRYQNRAQLSSPRGNIGASVPPTASSHSPPPLASPFMTRKTQSSQVGGPGWRMEDSFPSWVPGPESLSPPPSSPPPPPRPFTSSTFKPPAP